MGTNPATQDMKEKVSIGHNADLADISTNRVVTEGLYCAAPLIKQV